MVHGRALGLTFAGSDLPSICGSLYEHLSGTRTHPPHDIPVDHDRLTCGRAMTASCWVDQRIIGRRQEDLDVLPACLEFFDKNLGKRIVDTLTHFRLRARDSDASRRRDFEIGAKPRGCIGYEHRRRRAAQ